jgi:hypothetical protein
VVVQSGEPLLLVEAELPPLLPLEEAVERFRDVHLHVQRLVLLEEGGEELEVVLHLLHLRQELLRQLRVALPVLDPGVEVDHLQLQLYDLFVVRAALLQQLLDVAALVPAVVLQLPQAVVEADHPALHLAHRCLRQVLELVDLLRLRVLPLGHQLHLPVQPLLVLPRFLAPLQDLPVEPALELVQLLDLLLVDLDDCLHLLDAPVVLQLRLEGGDRHGLYLQVLLLDVGGLGRALPFQEEVVVVDLLLQHGETALDFVDLDGLLGLLLVEGLQQVHHDLPHLRLHLVPLEFLDLYRLFAIAHLILLWVGWVEMGEMEWEMGGQMMDGGR